MTQKKGSRLRSAAAGGAAGLANGFFGGGGGMLLVPLLTRWCGLEQRRVYMYMTALDDPSRVIAEPAGFLMFPEGEEYVGDVMNVLFSNGWIADEDGKVFIYYASCDTRMHVATSTVDRLGADQRYFPGGFNLSNT